MSPSRTKLAYRPGDSCDLAVQGDVRATLEALAERLPSVAEGERAWQIWMWPWTVRWGRLFTIVR